MLQLRPISENDSGALVRLMNNVNVSRYMSDRVPFPYTPAHAKAFMEVVKTSHDHYFFAVTLDSEFIGGAGLHPQTLNHRKNIEIGYWLGEPYWGKGYATETVKLLLEFAFNLPEIHKVFARTFSGNSASEKVLLKNGFNLEGVLKQNIFKNGEFLDEKIYGLLRNA